MICVDPLQAFLTNLQWAFGGAITLYVVFLLYLMFGPDDGDN